MAAVSVTTAAIRLDTDIASAGHPAYLLVLNEGPGIIYLGSANTVTSGGAPATDGVGLVVGGSVTIDLNTSGAALWGISASGTNIAKTLQVRAN